MGLLGDHMSTPEKTLEELQADLEAKAEALVDLCNKSSLYCMANEVTAVEAALERLYRLRKGQDVQPAEPAARPDVADIIAGSLQVSRGAAYDMMQEALKEVQPAPVQQNGRQCVTPSKCRETFCAAPCPSCAHAPQSAPAQESDDSLLLCASDLEHSAIYDNHAEMQACIRAVASRIKALATPPAAPAQEPKQSPPFTFRRFVAGSERAQDVAVHREVTLDAAIRVAAKICPPSESGHPTVLVYTPPTAQPTKTQVYGWVRMNGQFNSGVFHLGRECPPGWVKAAEPVSLIVAADLGDDSEGGAA
jgi:hypothetical protein